MPTYEFACRKCGKKFAVMMTISERELTFTYALARIRGEPIGQFVVMSKEEIDKIMARSPARHKGPWKTDYEPMAIKTPIRRLVKYLPISSELQRAVGLDEHADVGLDQGLEAIGEEVIEGLLPEDEVIIDADYTVVEGEGEGKTKGALDDLTKGMESTEPDEYTKLWAKGNEIFGDDEWKKVIVQIRKKTKVGSTKFAQLPVASKDMIVKAMEAAIEKGA